MLTVARRRFTKWYVRKGYKFYHNSGFQCPLYIKPILFLFSPSIYFYYESCGKSFLDGFIEGIRRNK